MFPSRCSRVSIPLYFKTQSHDAQRRYKISPSIVETSIRLSVNVPPSLMFSSHILVFEPFLFLFCFCSFFSSVFLPLCPFRFIPADFLSFDFSYVVGIIHTNYQFYARGEEYGRVKKPIVKAACAFTVRAHCHRIIKLSDTLQEYAREKEMVENVHGVCRVSYAFLWRLCHFFLFSRHSD